MPTIYFGDLHSHNGLGYGKGTLQRSIDIASEHLDFFAFTGHSSWHDMKPMEGSREKNWLLGFEKLRAAWPQVVQLTEEANRNPDFVAFLGFEWHSSRFGDQCVMFPGSQGEIARSDHLDDLRAFCVDRSALMIPHHLAYPRGHRGVNWDVFEPACTPFVEIYSEHGNSEDDRGPFPYFNHSLGGRVTSQTVQAALARGLRFGFSAGTDDHRGFPGGYGEGLTGVLADELTRPALFEALSARRVYGMTGDRIEIDFTVENQPMGSDIRKGQSVEVGFEVRARDELDVIELIQDGRIVHRAFPPNEPPAEHDLQVRVEWGWGPWLDLDLDRVADWEFTVGVDRGRFGRLFPCLQSGPFDENRRHRIRRIDDTSVSVTSYTGRRGAYRGNPNQSIVLELAAAPDTRLSVDIRHPDKAEMTINVIDLMQSGRMLFTGLFPAEGMLIHRPVPAAMSHISDSLRLDVPPRPSYLYLRVRQKNGHLAWTSPVFLNY